MALLAIIEIGKQGMLGHQGVERDGLRSGTRAPAWQAVDLDGRVHVSPAPGRWQVLVFADHSLREFTEVVEGLRALDARGGVELLILARRYAAAMVGVLPELGVPCPVVLVDPAIYHRYNVRVMPFVVIVDPAGRIAVSSLVNQQWQLARLCQLAGVHERTDA
ncbi:peroxiredoxin family protein [Nonomuraea typhae]|uniref:peroxiredoxin family protein n=1 Tax=Nonomuraea typhae TaxID=2603600 RepID=UPI0012FC25DB|nr:hypothetical protein [Nonomuraea typhae]